jgi:hypothetical protein
VLRVLDNLSTCSRSTCPKDERLMFWRAFAERHLREPSGVCVRGPDHPVQASLGTSHQPLGGAVFLLRP